LSVDRPVLLFAVNHYLRPVLLFPVNHYFKQELLLLYITTPYLLYIHIAIHVPIALVLIFWVGVFLFAAGFGCCLGQVFILGCYL